MLDIDYEKLELDIDDDSFEIESIPFDEIGLDDSVKMYFAEIKNYPILNKEEEKELVAKIKNGDEEAKELLIECNLKLVVSIAKKYIGKGLTLLDLIQEGNIGLIKALDKYDPSKDVKFSTYAFLLINLYIKRGINDASRNIRIPSYYLEEIKKALKCQKSLMTELNREPTIEEIAKKMDISVKKVSELMSYTYDDLSLDLAYGSDEDNSLLNHIRDNSVLMPEDYTISMALKNDINNIFDVLTEREKLVLRLRFGFDDDVCMSYAEIGRMLGVTRARVNQIVNSALKKIRYSSKASKCVSYTDDMNKSLAMLEEYREKSCRVKKRKR